MKRLFILLPLVIGLGMPLAGFSAGPAPVACEVTELPWSTVQAVLKKIAEIRDCSYTVLVDGYHAGRVTVEALGSGYRVTIVDVDGLVQILLEEMG